MHMSSLVFIVVAVMVLSFGRDGNHYPPNAFWEEFGIRVYHLSDLVVDGEVSADTDSLAIRVVAGKPGEFSVSVSCPHYEDKYALPSVYFLSDAESGAGKVFERFFAVPNPPGDSLSVLVSLKLEGGRDEREFILVKLKEEVGPQAHFMEVR